MTRSCHTHALATVGLMALVLGGATTSATAQDPKPERAGRPMHQDGMQGMRGQPHHVLAMAYRDNLVSFARAVEGPGTRMKTVDLTIVRPAVAEMRRSFDQMRQHHQAQQAAMGDSTMMPMGMRGDSAKKSMATMMKDVTRHLTAIDGHLTALETEVKGDAPDAAKVTEHTSAILKESAGMPATSRKDKAREKR